MPRTISKTIVALREQGLSYSQIQQKIGCAKSTVCYYCGTDQKQKYIKRQRLRRKQLSGIVVKAARFQSRKTKRATKKPVKQKTIRTILRERLAKFVFNKRTRRYATVQFTVDELLEKIGAAPRCYLTGRPIDLEKPKTYQLDHIVPASKGGDNSLENCGLACREANQAKNDLSVDEFLLLCADVVRYHKNSATGARTPITAVKGRRPSH